MKTLDNGDRKLAQSDNQVDFWPFSSIGAFQPRLTRLLSSRIYEVFEEQTYNQLDELSPEVFYKVLPMLHK